MAEMRDSKSGRQIAIGRLRSWLVVVAGLAYEHIYMKTWHPEDEEAVRFLQIVGDPNRTPVFVHCQRGADRTGTMCAIYRVAVQGWSKDEAIAEMTQGGFHFYSRFQNLIDYIRKLDIEAIKERAEPAGALR